MRRLRPHVLVALAAAAVLAAGLGGSPASAGRSAKAATTVKVVNFEFKPKKVVIRKGGRVTWKNREGRHTVTFRKLKYDKPISGRRQLTKRFKRTGVFRYYCRPHESLGQKGRVVVK